MDTFFSPAHIHVMVNHVPLIGLAAAIVPLTVALIRTSSSTLLAGLILVALCSLSIPAVMISGENAHENLSTNALGQVLDQPGRDLIEIHYERAEIAAKFVYLAIVLSIAGLLVMRFMPQHEAKLAVANLVNCAVCVILLAWAALPGGMINHPEFRDRLSPPSSHPPPTDTDGEVH